MEGTNAHSETDEQITSELDGRSSIVVPLGSEVNITSNLYKRAQGKSGA